MTESIYKEYQNKYYNPNDNDKKPGDNDNWKSIQKGFHDISATQLETSAGLTLGKGTGDETSVTAAELKEIKDPTHLETSGGLTLGKGTEDETSVTAAELKEMKSAGNMPYPTVNFSFTRNNTVFSQGANIIQMEIGQFPSNRLSGFTPKANYVYTGYITATAPRDMTVAVGVIPALTIMANDNGEIVLTGTMPIICIASGSFTGTINGVLQISPAR